MKLWLGVTDNLWFDYLAERQPDEVNFWQPSGQSFRALEPGAPFLFKLHSPLNYIVGGGFFVRFSLLPLLLAWDVFRENNGVPSLDELEDRINKYRAGSAQREHNPSIGCVVLTSPFFFKETDWIPSPADWSPNIVRGKTYDTDNHIGAQLWAQVSERLYHIDIVDYQLDTVDAWNVIQGQRYGREYTFRPRLGQGAFRVAVTESYNRRCAITGERTLPVLEAAHIKPHARSGPNDINNGLLLRSDLHILFDRGYMTVTDDLRVEISHAIKEEYENGRDYYALHGRHLAAIPSREIERPSKHYIEWHNQEVFRA